MKDDPKVLIGYAIGTEKDAISMYKYLINKLPLKCAPVLDHILKEERDHVRELVSLLKKLYNEDF